MMQKMYSLDGQQTEFLYVFYRCTYALNRWNNIIPMAIGMNIKAWGVKFSIPNQVLTAVISRVLRQRTVGIKFHLNFH